jgi:hypothetical protein
MVKCKNKQKTIRQSNDFHNYRYTFLFGTEDRHYIYYIMFWLESKTAKNAIFDASCLLD